MWSIALKVLARASSALLGRGPLASRTRSSDESGAVLERAIAAYRDRDWVTAEADFRRVIGSAATSGADRQVARNIYGRLLERIRRVDEAIDLYETNLREGFLGTFPSERLAEIYRRRGTTHHERRVLERAVALARDELRDGKLDAAPRLERLQERLRAVRDFQ